MSAKPKRKTKAKATAPGRPNRGFTPSAHADEEILRFYKQCGNKNETCRQMKIGDKRLKRILREAQGGPSNGGAKPKPSKASCGAVDVDKLISDHKLDYAQTLRDAMAEILVGNATIEPDKLRRYTGIPTDSWKELANSDEFLGYQVMHRNNRRRIWCSEAAREKLLALDAIDEVR